MPAERHTAIASSHREDLIEQNLTYQQELASMQARVRSINSQRWKKEKRSFVS